MRSHDGCVDDDKMLVAKGQREEADVVSERIRVAGNLHFRIDFYTVANHRLRGEGRWSEARLPVSLRGRMRVLVARRVSDIELHAPDRSALQTLESRLREL